MTQPLIPPFTATTARAKVQLAEDAWNTRNPAVVARAYSEDSAWRNRDEFFSGREAISPHFSPGGEMITQEFGFTKDFMKE